MGVIMAIIWFVTGMHWAFALGYLIMAVVADFVAGTKQYKSKKINSLSYILFSLGGTGRTLFSSLIPRGGRRPCWEMEPSKAISIPCRRPQMRESLSPCLPLSL